MIEEYLNPTNDEPCGESSLEAVRNHEVSNTSYFSRTAAAFTLAVALGMGMMTSGCLRYHNKPHATDRKDMAGCSYGAGANKGVRPLTVPHGTKCHDQLMDTGYEQEQRNRTTR